MAAAADAASEAAPIIMLQGELGKYVQSRSYMLQRQINSATCSCSLETFSKIVGAPRLSILLSDNMRQ